MTRDYRVGRMKMRVEGHNPIPIAVLPAQGLGKLTARAFGVAYRDMLSNDRAEKYVRPRHVAMYLARKLTDRSLNQIGKVLNRDHSTVVYAVRSIGDRLAYDEKLRSKLTTIEKRWLRHRSLLETKGKGDLG